jgi:putative tryptophan/tyrosine transport system substrate-binding protein
MLAFVFGRVVEVSLAGITHGLHCMKRREFITFLGRAAMAWPAVAYAQQPAMPVVGFLGSRSAETDAHLMAAFRRGLSESGYVEGKNVAVEYRWANEQFDRLPELAADLARRQVTVIATSGGARPALAAKAATATIPIVFTTGTDPVQLGLVASFSRPGGNATGVYFVITVLGSKRLELLHELAPKAGTIAFLGNPNNPDAANQTKDIQQAAATFGLRSIVLNASNDSAFDAAFATVVRQRAGALIIGADAFFNSRRDLLIGLAARHAVPAIYPQREFADSGGLMSYGTNSMETYLQSGIYTGHVLKGAKPAELPVVQSTKFELVINLKTAKTLRLEVPAKLLALADEVIE